MPDEWDAVVVGAGPNGLTAAATLGRAGWRVLVIEAAPAIGGGTRSGELTRPGFVHDICSAVHPMAVISPALAALDLEAHGVKWVFPEVQLAHPLDHGRAALLLRSVDDTAAQLGLDGAGYRTLMGPLVECVDPVVNAVMSPLSPPRVRDLPALARFAAAGARPATRLARSRFRGDEARGLIAGLAAHSMLSLRSLATGGYGLFLGLLGHATGWPLASGGSQVIADALGCIIAGNRGQIILGQTVASLDELPPSRVTLLDVSPGQLIRIAGHRLPDRYRRALERYRYGAGVWKVDWALDAPIPWTAEGATRSATVHVGGTLEEVALAEAEVAAGRVPRHPFVLVVQPTIIDPSRAPAGAHVAWAYCHVPNGATFDMTERIESQIERFAPGFRERVLGRHTMSPAEIERHDANYIGGDIAIGRTDLTQLASRPVLSRHPWRTPLPGLYLCSSATPPGPGVHGMCGWHAARTALRDFPFLISDQKAGG
jgi:phytoene dehydrogenase-like protein